MGSDFWWLLFAAFTLFLGILLVFKLVKVGARKAKGECPTNTADPAIMMPAPSEVQCYGRRLRGGVWTAEWPDECSSAPPITSFERNPVIEMMTSIREWGVAVIKRGIFPNYPEDKDSVDCSVFAPSRVSAGEAFLVQVFAHTVRQAEDVAALAQEFDSDTMRRGVTALGTKIARGSRLTIELAMQGCVVEPPTTELVWQGDATAVQFGVQCSSEPAQKTAIGLVSVSQNSIPIGVIRFKLEIVRDDVVVEYNPTGHATRYERAFVSYASRDRAEVLRRVQMLAAVGIEFFQDVLDLDPGDRWVAKLYQYIDGSDVLFLFWSTAAKESEWVAREWQYALEKKGLDFIQPVVIEGPPPVSPPPELSELHFNDKVLYFIAAERK